MKTIKYITLAISAVTLAIGCKPKTPTTTNPEELITTIKLELIEGKDTVRAKWNDPDGSGGVNPVMDSIKLKKGVTYLGTISLLDESKTPADNITEEIKKEADVHQFFYTFSSDLNGKAAVTILDKDSKNLPIGLSYQIQTIESGTGSLRIVLSHYDGVAKTTAPSTESDIDISLPVIVQ